MATNLVTIATYTYSHELDVIKALLESEGIECFTLDNFTVAIDPLVSNAIGGVKLQVIEEQAEKATEIVNKFWRNNDNTGTFDNEDLDYFNARKKRMNNIYRGYKIFLLIILLIVLFSFIFLI